MISNRDGHVRVLPLHVANKIAAGEVVERPASVVKELVENAIDAGARRIAITITQGGRKLVAVQDDGCGMTKDDAVLSLERQATSKIRDVTDIEEIDTLGFRGEAIPSIASVSRFTLTTRQADSDEGTTIQVNAGTLAEVRAAGCPPGTLVEVRDLFCNVPARRKFLRAYATEEGHVRQIFTVHALAHPAIGFSLTVDGRELYKLAPAANLQDRVRDLFGDEFLENMLTVEGRKTEDGRQGEILVSGFIEKPNLATPTRRDQYVFINGRPATSASIAYALREAYPRRAGDSRPAAVLFIDLPPNQVDVNVHPTKREVRFRDNVAVKNAIISAIENSLSQSTSNASHVEKRFDNLRIRDLENLRTADSPASADEQDIEIPRIQKFSSPQIDKPIASASEIRFDRETPAPQPVPLEFAMEPDSRGAKPWQWFKFLAQSASGYLLVETDSGIVTINPHAARERIAYEKLLDASKSNNRTVEQFRLPDASHPRDRPSLPCGRCPHQGRAPGDCGHGIPARGVRTRHVQDRRRPAAHRLPLSLLDSLDDRGRPFRRRCEARRTLARGADCEVHRQVLRRRLPLAYGGRGREARRGALRLPDALCLPAREARDDLHLDSRARPQVRPRLTARQGTFRTGRPQALRTARDKPADAVPGFCKSRFPEP